MTEEDIARRNAQVLGDGPRIEALPNDEVAPQAFELVNAIRAAAGAETVTFLPEYMRIILKHQDFFRCQMELGTALFLGLIPAQERELAILRIGWLTQAPYEWGQHVEIARRVNLSAEHVERVIAGPDADGWSAHEAAVLRGVDEMLGDYCIADATWATLAESWDEAQLIEYLVVVGQYTATAMLQNSLRVPLESGNPGLTHR